MLYQEAIELLVRLSKDAWVAGSQGYPFLLTQQEAEELLQKLSVIECVPEEE